MAKHDDKVIRIQGDKLCGYLGLEPGTKIELKTIKQIATATFGDSTFCARSPHPRYQGGEELHLIHLT